MAEGNNRLDWLRKLRKTRAKVTSDLKRSLLDEARMKALGYFETLVKSIEDDWESLTNEANNFMKPEELFVESLIAQGLDLPKDYPDPEELECRPYYIRQPTKSDYNPCRLRIRKETDSDSLSLGSLSLKSSESSSNVSVIEFPRGHQLTVTPTHLSARVPFESQPPIVNRFVLTFPVTFVYDVVSSEGLSLAAALYAGLWMKEGTKSVKVAHDICYSICRPSSSELIATSGISGGNRVRRYELPIEGKSTPREVEGYVIKDGKELTGMTCSADGLIAVCDAALRRITIHQQQPWYRVDTIHTIFGDRHSPARVAWLDEDHLCVKMADNKTIHCLSLRHKEVAWTQTVNRAWLLSTAFNRVYVSHWGDSINRFTVLRGDTGQILENEEIRCPGSVALKVFSSPRGGVVTCSWKMAKAVKKGP